MVWPKTEQVDRAARDWARRLSEDESVLAVGYFGSYARGDWGVGSDLDLVVVLEDEAHSPRRVSRDWKLESLPVPAELRVYSAGEWKRLLDSDLRMARVFREETVWLVGGESG